MTEKDYNPEQKNAKAFKKQETASKKIAEAPVKKEKKPEDKKEAKVKEEKVEKKDEKKKPEKEKPKKDFAVVNGYSLPISTKQSIAVCKFINHKKIETAIAELEQVALIKKAVPMKGEIPHRKGKIMSGRFPRNAAQSFINLLKTLKANANENGVENPVISEAVANLASRPYSKFGRVRKKRTHVKITAKEKMKQEKKNG